MSHEELLGRIKNLNVSLVEDMSSDSLALLTEGFSEPLVRAIMCRTQDNYEQKKIFTKIKSAYKSWRKDTDIFWGAMPNMEVYPDWMNKMQLDVECGMIITEDGRIPAPKSPTAKIPTALDTLGTGVLFQEIYEKTHPASTDNPPIKEIVYNISTKKPAKTQETAQIQARIAELEAELKLRDERIAEKDTKIESLKQLLEQKEFRPTKPEEAILKEKIARQKQKREDMLVELLLPSFYMIEADARSFVRKIDNGMDSDGVAEVARQYYLGNKIVKSKRGRSIWEILHAAKLYDKVEQSWTREMRKAD